MPKAPRAANRSSFGSRVALAGRGRLEMGCAGSSSARHPGQIPNAFARVAGATAMMARKKDYSWRHYLPRAKSKRGFRGRRGGSPATHIAHRVPLNQRPPAAADRATFGHWEGDLMHFGNHGPALLALSERHSRLVLLARLPGKHADVTADTMPACWPPSPRSGARPSPSTTAPSSPTTTASTPWAPRPSSAIPDPPGCHRPLGKTRLAALRRPSSCTTIPPASASAEVFQQQVLHLKCELTFPPSRE